APAASPGRTPGNSRKHLRASARPQLAATKAAPRGNFNRYEMTPYESRITQLAELSKDQYERQRKDAAKALRVRASVLDKDVAEARKHKSTLSAGFAFEDLQAWPAPVPAHELLQQLASTF